MLQLLAIAVGKASASLGSNFEPYAVLIGRVKSILHRLKSLVGIRLTELRPAVQLAASRL